MVLAENIAYKKSKDYAWFTGPDRPDGGEQCVTLLGLHPI